VSSVCGGGGRWHLEWDSVGLCDLLERDHDDVHLEHQPVYTLTVYSDPRLLDIPQKL
jgi:hypothetical protein